MPYSDFELGEVDLRAHAPLERDRRFEQQSHQFLNQPFNLDCDLPIRAALFRVDEGRWYLAIAIHHIAVDGLSINIIQRELAEHYQAFLERRAARLLLRLSICELRQVASRTESTCIL